MNGWFAVLLQLGDFLVKAAVAYSQTEQGEKELNDITVAWETRANTEDNNGQFNVTSRPSTAVDHEKQAAANARPGIKFS